MFAKSIVLSDAFLDMPLSARCLYFTLGMLADDDGFVGSPKAIMRQCGASQDDIAVLLQKRYILAFESGVIVIKHWRMNNYLQNDRHKPTTYLEELSTLAIDDKGAYTETAKIQGLKPMYTECIQNVYEMDTQVSKGKDSIGKLSKGKDSIGKVNNIVRFTPPTVDEVTDYCLERNNHVDPQAFIDFYESKGWYIGKNKMKDWKAAVRTWEKNERKGDKPKTSAYMDSIKNRVSIVDSWLE
jgi:hypothetical protein